MKGKLATYEYSGASTPRFGFNGLFGSPVSVLLTLIILALIVYICSQSNNPIPYFLGSMFALICISLFLGGQGPGLIVSTKYFVYNNQAILYENIDRISIDEAKLIFTLKHIDGSVIHLYASKFKSNANKDWKIKKNKQKKFYKVISKVTDNALRENQDMTLNIVNANQLMHYKRAEFS